MSYIGLSWIPIIPFHLIIRLFKLHLLKGFLFWAWSWYPTNARSKLKKFGYDWMIVCFIDGYIGLSWIPIIPFHLIIRLFKLHLLKGFLFWAWSWYQQMLDRNKKVWHSILWVGATYWAFSIIFATFASTQNILQFILDIFFLQTKKRK